MTPQLGVVEIDGGGRVTSLRGTTFSFDSRSVLMGFTPPGGTPSPIQVDHALRRVSETRMQMENLVTKPDSKGIYWATINKNNGDITLHAAPLYVGELLQRQLFAGKETTILTSATLCVDRNFGHIKSRLGIGDWSDELAVGSPFDYANAAVVLVPKDIPEPGQPPAAPGSSFSES